MEPPLVIDENFDGRSFEDKKSTELLCQGCKKNKGKKSRILTNKEVAVDIRTIFSRLF